MNKLLVVTLWLAAETALAGGVRTKSNRSRVGAYPGVYVPVDASRPPLFEFANAFSTGMGTACACTTPTGLLNGVPTAMTFTRASDGTCTKGNELSNIANGDLVICSTDQPRIMPGGDGSGVLGINVWNAITNSALRSQELDDVTYTVWGPVAGPPVVTSNAATAPDGTLTAERIVIPATIGAQDSYIFQTIAGSAERISSVYIKGKTVAGTTSLCTYSSSPAWVCSPCPYVTATWTRCVAPRFTSNVVGYWLFGNVGTLNGGVDGDATDIYVWGVQYESTSGGPVSPYIPTAGTAATRAAEVASFSLALSSPTISMAATYVAPPLANGTFSANTQMLTATIDVNNRYLMFVTSQASTSSASINFRTSSTSHTQATAGTMVAGTTHRVSAYYDGTNKAACLNGTCTSTAEAITLASGTFTVGIGCNAGQQIRSTVKLACIDTDVLRCR